MTLDMIDRLLAVLQRGVLLVLAGLLIPLAILVGFSLTATQLGS